MEQNIAAAVETAVVETVDNGEALQAMTETMPDTSFERIEKDADVLVIADTTVKKYIADCAINNISDPADHIRSEACLRGLWLAELRGKEEEKLARVGEIVTPGGKGMGYTNASKHARMMVACSTGESLEKYTRILKFVRFAGAVSKELSEQKKTKTVDEHKDAERKASVERATKRETEKNNAAIMAKSKEAADFSEAYHNKLFKRFERIAILVGHCERMTKAQIVSALIEALTTSEQPTGEEVVA